jgi:molecular chaperone GrpE
VVEDKDKRAPDEAEEDDWAVAPSEADITEQLEEALREKDQFRAMAQRSQADLVNYRRRAAEEMEESRKAAKSHLLLKVISVVDDFGRALEMVPEGAVAPGWAEGLQLVHRKLDSLLESEGVTRIEAEGRPFEPLEHEALLYQESPDKAEGTVLQVIREGYRLNGKVLRAAQVAVSKAPADREDTESLEQET